MFRVPDWLRYEVRHKIERLRDGYQHLHVKDSVNDHPRTIVGLSVFSVLLLGIVLTLVLRETPVRRHQGGKGAWFYDLNTGTLFTADSSRANPIEAPSGALPDGGPAGFRAHVYSYVLEPNATERFVGFLERPDPHANVRQLASDGADFTDWARGRLIRRVDDDKWVSPASPAGREIIENLTRPNRMGQTPVYHVPR